MDLAEGHLSAVRYMERKQNQSQPSSAVTYKGFTQIFNLGRGQGYSVIDMVNAMKTASGKEIPYVFGDRRAGDIDTCYADTKKAKEELLWESKRSLDDMCAGKIIVH